MKLLFFDTETTDLRPGNICQLSYILVDCSCKPQKTTSKNYFFTVEEMSENAEKIHGFSLEKLYDLSNGLYFEDTYEEFLTDFVTADVIIGHNVSFDIKFLKSELEFYYGDYNPKHIFCTMNYYKDKCNFLNSKGLIKNPSLGELIDYLNISKKYIESKCSELFEDCFDYHDARYDTTCTYLAVIEGIKKGFMPPLYFTNMIK